MFLNGCCPYKSSSVNVNRSTSKVIRVFSDLKINDSNDVKEEIYTISNETNNYFGIFKENTNRSIFMIILNLLICCPEKVTASIEKKPKRVTEKTIATNKNSNAIKFAKSFGNSDNFKRKGWEGDWRVNFLGSHLGSHYEISFNEDEKEAEVRFKNLKDTLIYKAEKISENGYKLTPKNENDKNEDFKNAQLIFYIDTKQKELSTEIRYFEKGEVKVDSLYSSAFRENGKRFGFLERNENDDLDNLLMTLLYSRSLKVTEDENGVVTYFMNVGNRNKIKYHEIYKSDRVGDFTLEGEDLIKILKKHHSLKEDDIKLINNKEIKVDFLITENNEGVQYADSFLNVTNNGIPLYFSIDEPKSITKD